MTYDNQHPYDGYDPNGTPIDELMKRLMQLQGRIASTISEVERVETEITEKQSQIIQTVDEISLEVFEINNDTGGKTSRIGRLEVTADEINSNVAAIDTRVGAAESSISQNATAITSRVTYSDFNGNNMVSIINQSATSVSIAASKINLTGIGNVSAYLQIGASRNDGSVKEVRFNGVSVIRDNDYGMRIASDELTLESTRISMEANTLDLRDVNTVLWGSNAPSTTARFG